jgi:5-methylcytosine-specific restriction endonuclease McrBC GTP-binding regulatory subunit McrB
LEDDPQIKILARHALETAILAKYQEQEIDSKIRITDADVRAYYEAHKSEFVRKDEKGKEIPMSYQEAKERARMMLLEERRKTLLDDLLNRLQQAEKVELYLDRLTPK